MFGKEIRTKGYTGKILIKTDALYKELMFSGASDSEILVFCKSHSQLTLWFQSLGIFANFRGITDTHPILLPSEDGSTKILEEKETKRILWENFPGEKNGPGGIISVFGNRFRTSNVIGGKEIAHATVCTNKGCLFPYKRYLNNLERCPFCDNKLERITIHKLKRFECKEEKKRGVETTSFNEVVIN